MKKIRAILTPLAAFFAVAGQAQIAPNAAESQEPVTTLPQFEVSGSRTDPYRAVDVTSVARTAGSILDAPLTINVVTPQMLRDFNPDTLYQLNTYFPGVSEGRGTGAGGTLDREDFRGYENFTKTVDDFSSFIFPTTNGYNANIDPVLIDHEELVMGPDSILSPTGAAGGSINVITKSPLFNRSVDLSGEVGNYAANLVTLDATGPLGDGKHLAYRVIAAWQDAQSPTYPGCGNFIVQTASAMLTYKFSDTAKVTVKYIGVQEQWLGEIDSAVGTEVSSPNSVGGVVLSSSPQPGFSYNGWNGNCPWNDRQDRLNILESEFTAALGPFINMRAGAEFRYNYNGSRSEQPSANPAETWNAQTGVETAVAPINITACPEVYNQSYNRNRDVQFQNDYTGKFNAGPVSFEPVVGAAYERGEEPVNYALTDSNVPTVNLTANNGFYDPVVPNIAASSLSSDTPETAWIFQAYAVLKTSFFNNRLIFTTGTSHQVANCNEYSIPYLNLPGLPTFGKPTGAITDLTFANTGVAADPRTSDDQDTYLVGVVGKLAPNVSTYCSYSTNAALSSSPVWEVGKQIEYGVKSEFFNKRISISADHFQISESNVSTPNPLFNIGQSTIANLLSDETNHGFEANIVGGVTRDLSLIFSYTNMHLRDPAGRRIRTIPDLRDSVLLNYHPSTGFFTNGNVYVGVVHEGTVAGENTPNLGFTSLGVPEQVGFYLASWTLVNVGAGYHIGRYGFKVNVDNALNAKFWTQANNRTSIHPADVATVRFTATVHFF